VLALLRTGALILSLALPSPAHAAGPAGWDHPGFDAEDSYYNPGESAINAGSVAQLTRRWSVRLREKDETCTGPSAPIVADGRLFVTDDLGISAYRALTGAPLWHYDWPDPGDSTTARMAVSGGVLVAASQGCQSMSDPDGILLGLDVATGRARWQVPTGIPIYDLVVDKGVAVVSGESPSDDPATYAYRATDGHLAWSRAGYLSSSVSADGRVLLTRAGTSSAAAVTTGAFLWTKPRLWYAESATPTADRFLVRDGTALAAVASATGAVIWTAPGKTADLLATDGRRVYRAAGRVVEALSAATGRPLWSRQFAAPAAQPVRAGGLVYTGAAVLSAATGAAATPGTLYPGKPVVTGGRLYTVDGPTLSSYAP
jgi:outer membrane protein assembly factor BamB